MQRYSIILASFPGSTPQLFSHRVEKRGGSLVYFITCYVTLVRGFVNQITRDV